MMAAPIKVKASLQQIQLLVENLERFKYIWDVNFPDFHNRVAKAHEWESLADVVGLPVVDTRRTYETQRRKFRKVSITDYTILYLTISSRRVSYEYQIKYL